MSNACRRAEIIAGAIALNEVQNSQRDEYRRHLASCAHCLQSLGGEREIERVIERVHQARDAETWQPARLSLRRRRRRHVASSVRIALSLAAIAAVAMLYVHPPQAHRTLQRPVVAVTHLPKHHAVAAAAPPVTRDVELPAPQMIVEHNVVTLKAPVTASEDVTHPRVADVQHSTTVVARPHRKRRSPQWNIPIWRRGRAIGPRLALAPPPAALPARLTGRAESISISPVPIVRDVMPLGGETTINPEPPMIAYREGAEGTTAFEVSVDEHGIPTKCTITKSSGYLVLDETVCKAAMKARFSPREVNGRAVPGIYRDAFTFRNPSTSEGL